MKEIIKRILENSYLFYHSKNTKPDKNIRLLKNKIEQLQLKFVEYSDNDFYSFIIRKSENEKFIFINKLNEQYDYDLSDLWENAEKINFDYPLSDYDTLLSYSIIKNDVFFAVNDYNAIIKHYYYKDDDVFMSSNNSFLIAYLCNSYLSDEAVYETLFFRFPYKTGSYFKNVKSLKPFQVLKYIFNNNNLILSNTISQLDLVDKLSFETLPEAAEDYFKRLKFDNPVNISFSGGSDSTTLAALLTKYRIPFNFVSFEGHNEYDTKKIIDFSKKSGNPLYLIKAKGQNNTEESNFEYTIISNGYIVSNHFYNFYKNIDRSVIFDGYSFLAGDFSDAYISDIHGELIKNDNEDIIYNYFAGFNKDFLINMTGYIKDNYTFINCNSDDGLIYIQNYLFDFVNGIIHAGAILPSLYFGHKNYSFYLSKKFMLTVLKNKYGVAKSFSKRNDYPGYAKGKYALGLLANYCNNIFCYIKLDMGLNLNDIFNNSERKNKLKMYLYRKRKAFLNKTLYTKNNSFGAKSETTNEELMEFSNKFISDYNLLNKKSLEAMRTLYIVDKSLLIFSKFINE